MLVLNLAEIHLPTLVVLPAGGACLLLIAWFWTRLARDDVPATRRKVRRASLVPGMIAICAATFGFGIVDPDVRPVPYVVAWVVGGIALLCTICFVLLDAWVSIGIHRSERERARAELLARALAQRGSRKP